MNLQAEFEVFETKLKDYEALKKSNATVAKEKTQMVNRIDQLQEQLVNQNELMEQKPKEWLQRMKTLQESSSNQILTLSSEMESSQRELINKIARLDAELKRVYEKDSQALKLKLKNVQCEKSDKEAFSARSLVSRLQEELRIDRQEKEKQIIQNAAAHSRIKVLKSELKIIEENYETIEKEKVNFEASKKRNS